MKKLKAILASSAYISADLATEASYIFDFGGTVRASVDPTARGTPAAASDCGEGDDLITSSRLTGKACSTTADVEGWPSADTSRLMSSPHISGTTRSAAATLSVESVLGPRNARRGGGAWIYAEQAVRTSVEVEANELGALVGGQDASFMSVCSSIAEAPSAAEPVGSLNSIPVALQQSSTVTSPRIGAGPAVRSRENTLADVHIAAGSAMRDAEESFLVADANFGARLPSPKHLFVARNSPELGLIVIHLRTPTIRTLPCPPPPVPGRADVELPSMR